MASQGQITALDQLAASRREQLQRIKDAGLIEQGRVFILSLEPIKAQVGNRWSSRSEIVWDGVERALAKSMPPPDVYVRLNDTTVLVAIASTDSYEGQIRCVVVLRSLLLHFLGRSADDDVALSRISSIDGDVVSSERVDVNSAPMRAAEAAQTANRRPEHWTPPLTERRAAGTLPLTYHGETPYQIDVVPVWRLDQETISAYAIRLILPDYIEQLSDLDHEMLSHLTLGHLLPILEDYRTEGASFALIVPLAFAALSARRPRMALLGRCGPVKDIMRRAVVAEITGLHPGVPTGLIKETVAMIKPFVRVVTATVRTTADVAALYREAAFYGVAVRWRSGSSLTLEHLLKTARRRTPNVVVHGVPEQVSSEELRRHNATHVTWNEKSVARL